MPLSLDRLAGAPERDRPETFALIASSDGLEAVAAVLRALPEGFPAAGLVALEADDGETDALAALRRDVALPVVWAEDGERLRPGWVLVCPPGMGMEILPDETLALGPTARPLDGLLVSLAESLGARAVTAILGGEGEDGTSGALAFQRTGGTVVVQSEETAQHPALPLAIVARGAAGLALPLHEIGPLLAAVVAGKDLPAASDELRAVEAMFAGAGEMTETLRTIDWSRTPLGPVGGWPATLRTALRIVLESPLPAILLWTRDLLQLYNAPYRELMGDKRPGGLAQPNRERWPEMWPMDGSIYERVFRGESVGVEDALYPLMRHGALHDVWLTVYYVPVRDEAGEVAGVMVTAVETTEKIVAARRFGTLQALSSVRADTEEGLCERAAAALALNPDDAPFALLYLLDGRATLRGRAGVPEGSPAAPPFVELGGGHPAWPLAKVAREGAPILLTDLDARFRGLGLPPSALLLPLPSEGDASPSLGVMVVGINPRQPLDGAYRGFLDLVATRLGASLAAIRSRIEETARRERAAELDWAKSEFFANVSHEFRTPLTLMLAPLEELLYRREELPQLLADEVEVASRSARRLLALVNTLLDFSQIEAGRMRLQRRATDLAALTREVAGLFRPAAERAGLRLRIECPPLPEPAWVDVEMWERIVSNLVSNALKFTFEGEVAVALRELPAHVELVVGDTGVGIPKAEIPNLFQRFHRVRGTRARTLEGSGVGLALVAELARLHGGRVRAQSVEGEGSAFTVWIPREAGSVEDVLATRAAPTRRQTAETLAGEAARWGAAPDPFAAPSIEELSEMLGEPLQVRGAGARVLVVDDNADMRDYLSRLLTPYWDVETAVDGADALRKARQSPPGLILADMAMPNLSGAELVRQVRKDETLQGVPVVLLTARAGEESAVEGLLAGADDYLAKPFVARELIARVGAQIELARVRRRAQELNEILVRFSDAVRGSVDPRTVAETACRLVAEKLNVERAYWAEVDWATREYAIGGAFYAPGVSVIGGRFPVDAWEPFTSSHLAGRPVVVDDTQADPRVPPEVREGYAGIDVGADLAVPVTADGRLVCTLAVNQRLPRRWTPEEVALVESVANRCWAEVVRARAEAALRDNESRLRIASEAAELGVFEWDPSRDQVSWENDRMFEIFGRSREDGPVNAAMFVEEVVHPDDAERFNTSLKSALTSGRLHYTGRFRRKDGALRGVEFTGKMEHAPDGAPLRMLGVTADVTERVRAQESLRESEEKYRRLFNEMDEAYAVVEVMADASGRWNDFRFLDANPAFMRHTGMPYPVGRTATDLLGNPNPRWAEIYGRVVETGEPIRVEEGELTLGRVFDLNVFRLGGEGSRRIAALFTDVTERKRAEEELRASNVRFQSVANLVPDLLWSSRPDGSTEWYNQRWSEYTGQAFERAIRWGWLNAIHPDDREDSARRYHEAVESGRTLVQEHRIRRHDGEYRWFLVRAEPVRDESGVLVMFGSATDIHAQRTTLATVRESEERQAFLLRLSDALRPLAAPAEVRATAARLLGERLGAHRAFYAEVEGGDWRVAEAYEQGVERQAEGRHPIADFGRWIVDLFQNGQRLIVRDLHADERFDAAGRAAHEAYRILGAIAVPLVKEGALVAILVVHSAVPRDWTEVEIALVEETAERTWAAVERARAEAALRESESRMAAVFDVLPAGLALADAEGKILRFNEALHRIWGVPPVPESTADYAEWKGRWAATGEPLAADDWAMARALRTGEMVPGDVVEIERFDGGRATIVNASSPIRDENGNVVGGVVAEIDITAQRRAEEATRLSEARLRAVAQNLPGGAVFVVDRDLRYTLADGEALVAAGFRSEDLVGRTVSEAMPPEIVAEYEANYRRVLAGGTFEIEHEAHGRAYVSRGVPLAAPDGTIDAALVVSYDVTERKRAEAALHESRRLFDAALSSLAHHVFVLDAAGRLRYANEALLAYWGIARSEALGRTPFELGHSPEMAAQIADALARAFATGGPVSGTFYHPGPAAPEVAYEYVYTPFGSAEGGLDRVVGWSREVDPATRGRREPPEG